MNEPDKVVDIDNYTPEEQLALLLGMTAVLKLAPDRSYCMLNDVQVTPEVGLKSLEEQIAFVRAKIAEAKTEVSEDV